MAPDSSQQQQHLNVSPNSRSARSPKQQTSNKRTFITAKNSDEIATFYTSIFSPDSMITRSKSKGGDIQAVQVSPLKSKGRNSNSASPIRNNHAYQILCGRLAPPNMSVDDDESPVAAKISSNLVVPTNDGLAPNTMNISVECRTRKSFSDLGLAGGDGCGLGLAHKGLERGEVLTSNNVVVDLSMKAGEHDGSEVFGTAPSKTVASLAYPHHKPRVDRVMSITIETTHSEDGRRLSEMDLGAGAINGGLVEDHTFGPS